MFEELVLSVDVDISRRVEAIGLDALGLKEREHLQQWVVDHPEILGPGTQVITTEDDQWQSSDGAPVRDRLDVLGIDPDGRLVVAELKRGPAPSTVHMQAVNYAAMVSRLKLVEVADLLSKAHPNARKALDLPDGADAITSALETVLGMSESTIRSPRIVLIATDFPTTVTAATVWLGEQGVDMTLVRFRPYRLGDGSVIVSFARIFPPPDTEEFTIGRRAATPSGGKVGATPVEATEPAPPWSEESLRLLSRQANSGTLALLDLCSSAGEQPVTVKDIESTAGLTTGQVRGQLAGLTMMLKNPKYGLERRPWPVRIDWQPGGVANYYMKDGLAEMWARLRGIKAGPADDGVVP